MNIPFFRVAMPSKAKNSVIETLSSPWITTGPKCALFEQVIQEFTGVKNCIALNSCTAGLHLSLCVLNIGPGDEVIIPTNTFCATANVVRHCGATPVIVDVCEPYLTIDPAAVKRKITKRTKAIIAVHFAGNICEMAGLRKICRKHQLKLIEDAAHAIGAYEGESHVGGNSDFCAFSFYATKNLSTAEGGALLAQNSVSAAKARTLSLHGLSKDAWKRYDLQGTWKYDVHMPGYKYNMTDITAAIGLAQMERFETDQKKRYRLIQRYNRAFKNIDGIDYLCHQNSPQHRSGLHLYVIRLNTDLLKISRDEFIVQLNRMGIGTSVHFIPLHRFSYYRKKYQLRTNDFPVAEAYYKRAISIPLFASLKRNEQDYIIKRITDIAKKNRK